MIAGALRAEKISEIRKEIRDSRRGTERGAEAGNLKNESPATAGPTMLRHKRVLARVIRFARAIRLSSHGGGYRAVMKHVILSSRRALKIIAPTVPRERYGDGSAP